MAELVKYPYILDLQAKMEENMSFDVPHEALQTAVPSHFKRYATGVYSFDY